MSAGGVSGSPAGAGLPLGLAGGAAGRIAPVQAEMTLSFLSRVAARYHLHVKDLLAALTMTGHLTNLKGRLRPDGEVHLNAEARARVARLCRVEPTVLERALPAWTRQEPRGPVLRGAAGRLLHGEEAVAAWGPACPGCTAARTGYTVPARRYLSPEQRVCPRHQYWLLYLPGTGGLPVHLAGCPEVVRAGRRHQRILRRNPSAAQAFTVAQAVTGMWWEQPWPHQEQLWPRRLAAVRPAGTDPLWWKAAARDVVTYPETVALAGLLSSSHARQLIARQAGGHLPYRLGDLPWLLEELARRLKRPWLAEQLHDITRGPLFAWAHTLTRTRNAASPAAQRALWKVSSPHRPRPLLELLPPPHPDLPSSQARFLRGYGRSAEQAFAQGLAHARSYHQQHGHLAVPVGALHDGYPLGTWLSNQRARHVRMPARQFTALSALDPWWNVPWGPLWQRLWHQAARHTRDHGPLDAATGLSAMGIRLGEWLYEQCVRYQSLHPEQQRLLAGLGIDREAAQTARRPRRSYSERFRTGLAHAAAYAARHGQLATVGENTLQDGFPLGVWLARLRHSRRDRPRIPADRVQALAALDPWWNPPWSLYWQRHYYATRAAVCGHTLNPANGFDDLPDAAAAAWLRRQCSAYHRLHPDQQRLLAGLGITPDIAAARAQPLWHTALEHARAFADQHGHLAVPYDTHHNGFGLGRWLVKQRHRTKNGAPCPAADSLSTIDPWWNPPWNLRWQRAYYHARTHPDHRASRQWLHNQRAAYHRLHPGQQHLLTQIGITD
ncbi:Helicase associated domain protein [Streptomyces sp. NPDC094149]|uniref:Helicase associated domain protein n=1 Tax=Streptomyces sp. NPDC094149 TaxID=3155079 RepID=UPI00332675F6